jgi:DNA-binding response OmpR family regulator
MLPKAEGGVVARILIVDDESLIALACKLLLEDAGYECDVASDGEQALSHVVRRPPDLIITDNMMPRMDGAELARALRDNPATALIPIIMNSALSSNVVVAKAVPVDILLMKPVRARHLLAAVTSLLPPRS